MKILILDTYYPDAIKAIPFDPSSTYDQQLQAVLNFSFGTADFYSRNLRALGHEVVDVIANHGQLQGLWARQYWDKVQLDILLTGNSYVTSKEILRAQMEAFKPDVVFLQDLSLGTDWIPDDPLVAAQCSCRTSGPRPNIDALFTSFPFYVKHFEAMGIPTTYLPLAFEPRMLEGPQPERDIDISFVGGVGRNSHWLSGTDTLEIVAERFGERFHWYGYGLDNLPANSALRDCYRGPAYGRAMYDVYRRSKIVVNRHGEVAQGYANNLRMYEATGMGALLMTEDAPNLKDLFPVGTVVPYSNSSDLCEKIEHFLSNDGARESIAAWGQDRTLYHHLYALRMLTVSEILSKMLVSA